MFGVLTRSATEELQVGYLTEVLPATPELLAAAAPAAPTEVFRAAAPCAKGRASILMAQDAGWPPESRQCSIR